MDSLKELHLLPDEICWKLAAKLDRSVKPNWKSLIANLPKQLYDSKQIALFHLETLRYGGSPTLSLLKDLGKKGKTVNQFVEWMRSGSGDNSLTDLVNILAKNDVRNPNLCPQILEGPAAGVFHAGGDVTLSCIAKGEPPFKFQWFWGNQKLNGQTSQCFILRNAVEHQSGFYVCVVSNKHGYAYSEWARIDIVTLNFNRLFEPKILSHPKSQWCMAGESVRLECDAVGNPSPAYMWYKDGMHLLGSTQHFIQLISISDFNQGMYVCEAWNIYGIARSLPAQVTVEEVKVKVYDEQMAIQSKVASRDSVVKNSMQFADPPIFRGPDTGSSSSNAIISMSVSPTYKFALLIGNQSYYSSNQLGKLVHPLNDTRDLACSLSAIGFQVVSLINLDLRSMKDALRYFCHLLGPGVYSLFYFAGHGFEKNSESYMMPVDASEMYIPSESLSVTEVLQSMTSKRPKLTLLLIDCCRAEAAVKPISDTCQRMCAYSDRRDSPAVQRKNVLIVYGCCSQGRVLESAARENGFFAEHLKKHIQKDINVNDVIFEVARGINLENIVDPATGRTQVVYCLSTLCDMLKLTDSTMPGPSSEYGLIWQQAIAAPQVPVPVLTNDDLTVNLMFSADFSNCLLIYSNVSTSRDTSVHRILFIIPSHFGGAHAEVLCADSLEDGIGSNYVRICNLERLNDDITIHIQVKYSVHGVKHQQNALYTIKDKPLYAKVVERMSHLTLE